MNTTFEGTLDIFWANYTEPTATPKYQLHFVKYRAFRGGAVKSKLLVRVADLEFYLTELGFTSSDAKSWIQQVQERRADETYAYSVEEELTMIDAVPEPASTVLATAAFTGARRGELRGMSWENYRDGELFIAQSIWNGIATEPKNRKSKAAIPIIGRLAGILAAHRARTGNPMSGPIFSNEAGEPMDPNNLLQRVILPALNVCGICSKQESEHGQANHKYERNTILPVWHGWHAFRRGLATNLHRLGVPAETIQAILRHSNVAVTQACYIKTVRDDAKAAMEKLETALNDTNVTPKQPIPITRAVM
jgi:integrase